MTNAAVEGSDHSVTLDGGQESRIDDQAVALGQDQVPEDSAPSNEEAERRNRLQERFGDLTSQRDEWRRKAQEAEVKARELEMRQQQDPTEVHLIQQLNYAAGQKPKLEDFSDEMKWTEAYEQWVQAMNQMQSGLYGYQQQREAQLAQHRQQEEAARVQEEARQANLAGKVRESILSREDWYGTVYDPNVPSLQDASPAAWEAVMESSNFADVTYYLAKNPEEVRKLSAMTPVKAVRHIVLLEAKLGQPRPKPTGDSPPSALPGSTSPTAPDKMDITQWMAWRNAQVRR